MKIIKNLLSITWDIILILGMIILAPITKPIAMYAEYKKKKK